jgi:group I intron endonuclease
MLNNTPREPGVYAIKNRVTQDEYIGSAINIRSRWVSHRSALKNRGKSPPRLQELWDSAGEASFEFSVLELCPKDQTLICEQKWIDARNPTLNTRLIAHSNLGTRWSDEANKAKGRPKKLYTAFGVTDGLKPLAQEFAKATHETVRTWVKGGMDIEEALLKSPNTKADAGKISYASQKKRGTAPAERTDTHNGVSAPIHRLITQFAVVSERAVRRRLNLGWSLSDALTKPHQRVRK